MFVLDSRESFHHRVHYRTQKLLHPRYTFATTRPPRPQCFHPFGDLDAETVRPWPAKLFVDSSPTGRWRVSSCTRHTWRRGLPLRLMACHLIVKNCPYPQHLRRVLLYLFCSFTLVEIVLSAISLPFFSSKPCRAGPAFPFFPSSSPNLHSPELLVLLPVFGQLSALAR